MCKSLPDSKSLAVMSLYNTYMDDHLITTGIVRNPGPLYQTKQTIDLFAGTCSMLEI